MDISLRTHRSYFHQHVSQLPTPALVLSLPILKQNIQRLLDDVSEIGILFRPHVKTLKVTTQIVFIARTVIKKKPRALT